MWDAAYPQTRPGEHKSIPCVLHSGRLSGNMSKVRQSLNCTPQTWLSLDIEECLCDAVIVSVDDRVFIVKQVKTVSDTFKSFLMEKLLVEKSHTWTPEINRIVYSLIIFSFF